MNFVYVIINLIIFVNIKLTTSKGLNNENVNGLNIRKYYEVEVPRKKHNKYLKTSPFTNNALLKLFFSKYKNNKEKPFVDLTRVDYETYYPNTKINAFSTDYLDVSDFGRIEQNRDSTRDIEMKKDKLDSLKAVNVARKMIPINGRLFRKFSDVSDDESDEPESSKEVDNEDLSQSDDEVDTGHIESPKRFQVINNFMKTESDEEDEESSKIVYVQAPTRYVYVDDLELRRRLPQFMPKRVYWDENDYKSLRNYWIHGPRGRFDIYK